MAKHRPDMLHNRFILQIVRIKHEAIEMGLYKTGHALEAAVQAVGWEVAEKLEKSPPRAPKANQDGGQ